MSRAGVLEPPRGADHELAPPEPSRGPERRGERPRRGDGWSPAGAGGGRLALGDAVAGAWEGLLAAGSAPCPVCRGKLEWEGTAGRCRDCGATLS